MRYQLIIKAFLSALMSISAVTLHGQTRFIIPDTAPSYTSYTYLDECVAAINRVKFLADAEDRVWEDTVNVSIFKFKRPLAPHVVETATGCLAKVNVDTISLGQAHKYAAALLVANRDEDVERMYLRLIDSVKSDTARVNFFMSSMIVYMNSQPVRLEKIMQLYEIGLMNRPKDSISQELFLRGVMGAVSLRTGDPRVAHRIANELLAITDTLSEKYRTDHYIAVAKEIAFGFVSQLMTEEAVDSLTVSTQAYRKYLVRVWKSVVGVEPDLKIGPFAEVAPEPVGHYWYSNLGSDNKIRPINPTPVLEKGKITILYFGQAGCHADYESVQMGRSNGFASLCWADIHKIRRIMAQYPSIKLVIISSTFGSFSNAPPLEPQQEADTLAKYFLDFHKLKGVHVVYKTDFIRVQGYDRRRIDTDTENSLAYRFGNPFPVVSLNNGVLMVDEVGQIFHYGPITDKHEQKLDARLKAVMSRPANKTENARAQ